MDLKRLSKTISYALRHHPDEFGLQLDVQGWVSLDALLAALRKRRAEWRHIGEDTIHMVMANADKQRFELRDGRIRAYYGHSLPAKIQREAAPPPTLLYHGTTPEAARIIQVQGLRPMRRQYVHLSEERETARMVALRRTSTPVLLVVRSRAAYEDGIFFAPGNDAIWLSDPIPARYLEFPPEARKQRA
uniref:Probable RNA 2'-phosphotransferase n=1 Tax=Thermosporothrix sp. COM3 TaxID=2490863 RepID=A0A455SQ77_9CHLR|nr:putative RNA 2'-phosphotransferase [Thermosporothrix sp. COM3]